MVFERKGKKRRARLEGMSTYAGSAPSDNGGINVSFNEFASPSMKMRGPIPPCTQALPGIVQSQGFLVTGSSTSSGTHNRFASPNGIPKKAMPCFIDVYIDECTVCVYGVRVRAIKVSRFNARQAKSIFQKSFFIKMVWDRSLLWETRLLT